MNPDMLNIDEAAVRLGVSKRWMRRSVEERRLRFYKLGGTLRFRVCDLDDFLISSVVEPRSATSARC